MNGGRGSCCRCPCLVFNQIVFPPGGLPTAAGELIRRTCVSSLSHCSQYILTVWSEWFRWHPIRRIIILFFTVQWCGLSQTLLTERTVVECVIGTSLSVTGTHKHVCKWKKICTSWCSVRFYLIPWQHFSTLYERYSIRAYSQNSIICMIPDYRFYVQFWRIPTTPSWCLNFLFMSVIWWCKIFLELSGVVIISDNSTASFF